MTNISRSNHLNIFSRKRNTFSVCNIISYIRSMNYFILIKIINFLNSFWCFSCSSFCFFFRDFIISIAFHISLNNSFSYIFILEIRIKHSKSTIVSSIDNKFVKIFSICFFSKHSLFYGGTNILLRTIFFFNIWILTTINLTHSRFKGFKFYISTFNISYHPFSFTKLVKLPPMRSKFSFFSFIVIFISRFLSILSIFNSLINSI